MDQSHVELFPLAPDGPTAPSARQYKRNSLTLIMHLTMLWIMHSTMHTCADISVFACDGGVARITQMTRNIHYAIRRVVQHPPCFTDDPPLGQSLIRSHQVIYHLGHTTNGTLVATQGSSRQLRQGERERWFSSRQFRRGERER